MIGPGSQEKSYLSPVADLIGEGESAGFDLAVSSEGRLTRRERGVNFNFAFRFRDRPFTAVAASEGPDVRLTFAAEFGVLPFTQEDLARRKQILGLLPQLRRAGLTWEITGNQAVRVGSSIKLTGIRAPREILAAVIEQLIVSRSWFDAIAEIAYVPRKLPPRRPRPAAS